MARTSKFKKALDNINSYLENSERKVFTDADLNRILIAKGREWDLPETMSLYKFIDELVKYTHLALIEIPAIGYPSYTSNNIKRFAYKEVSVYEIALSIKANTYLSHYSSLFLLGLTEQLPKDVYVTFEQSEKRRQDNVIEQEAIDNAFAKPQREPSFYYQYGEYRIMLLNGKFSKKAGVLRINSIFGKNLYVTNMERTLIDITVRPAYSGGVTEVLNAYKRAADKLSINKLASILFKLNFIYPYHQAIGFYLEKSEAYKDKQIDIMREKPKIYKFYLTYNMSDKEYSEEWCLFYPKNF